MLWLYNALLVLLSPVILLFAYWHPNLREGLKERLGYWRKPLRIQKLGTSKTIWLHGVSAGEARLIKPLLMELKQRLPEASFFATTITPTGRKVLDQFAADYGLEVSYFPLADLPWIVAKFLRYVRPRMFISTEAEAWPNLMYFMKRRKVKCILVNARIFTATKSKLELGIIKWLLRGFDRIICQTQQFAMDFERIGIPKDKLRCAGNIKSDFQVNHWGDEMLRVYRERHGWEGRRVLVAGSTHPGEEELVLDAFAKLQAKCPEWSLALTPRHPERRDEVAALCKQRGLESSVLSKNENGAPVLIVDKMGVLLDYYRVADLVILGGTFNRHIGGHNILEPAHFAKPVIIGPYIDSIADVVLQMRAMHAVAEVKPYGLTDMVESLAQDEERRSELGRRALDVVTSQKGATKRTVNIIVRELKT